MILTSLIAQNYSTGFFPNNHPAPLELDFQVSTSSSGSDHMRSQSGPETGICTLRSRVLIVSIVFLVGERPPCTQKTSPQTIAARGRQSKVSLKQYQMVELPYFLTIQSQKPQARVILVDSWLPRSSTIISGYFTLYKNSSKIVQTELKPLSTQSPRKIQRSFGICPPLLKSSNKSQNWPWISPQIVTGACTGCTFDYQNKIALTLRQRILTATSGIILH